MKKPDNKTVLLIDDEPEYLDWVFDMFENLGLTVDSVQNLGEAYSQLDKKDYALVLLDMNVPAKGLPPEMIATASGYKYAGLVMAEHLFKLGYSGHQVIAYSVHDDDLIEQKLLRFKFRYVLKGRPEVLVGVVKKSLSQ